MVKPGAFLSRQCPYCRCLRTQRRYAVDGEPVSYCPDCNLIFREKHDTEESITNYYRNDYYRDWGDDRQDRLRNTIYLEALKFIETKIGKGSLLDIGAGSGGLLSIARGRGWEIAGQEISLENCRRAKEKYGVELISDDLRVMDWKESCFDAITMVNVLDHLPEPWWVLRKAYGALKQGGALYIRVPNGNLHSFFYRITGGLPINTLKEKLRKFLVLHLYHLTPSFFRRVLKDQGFTSVVIFGAPASQVFTSSNFSHREALVMYLLKKYYPLLSNPIDKLTKGNLTVSPSIDVFAHKHL